jgi:hypothetical protein
VNHRSVTVLLQGVDQPFHMPHAASQLCGSLALRNQLLLGFSQRHQPVTIGLAHQ